MNGKVLLGWYWSPAHAKIEVGQILTAEGPLDLHGNGIYASLRALDALKYARGATVCRVELSGEIVESDNILCARHCKILAMADATMVLHKFACQNAEQALLREREAGREPDKQSWAAIEAKRKWLEGKATDEELIAAYTTACIVASNAAWDMTKGSIGNSTWGATWRAAYAAASAAARKTTWYAAWNAAWETACDAARAAAWDAAGDATSDAVWHAARDTVWDIQNTKLEEMLNALLK
jgi:hypothetical protein